MTRVDENPYKTTTRWRYIPTGFRPSCYGVEYSGVSSTPSKFVRTGPELCEAQMTVSEGHPFWSDIKDFNGLKPDLGGDFLTQKWVPKVDKSIHSISKRDGQNRLWECAGHYVPNTRSFYGDASGGWGYIQQGLPGEKTPNNLPSYFPGEYSSDDQLRALGTTAIARTRPDVSPAQATVALGELRRDGLPFLAKVNKREFDRILHEFQENGVAIGSSKKSSDYFLENQFGLMPLISDLKAFVSVARGGVSVLDNLHKNSGKQMRRSYHFPHESFSSTRNHPSTRLQFGLSSTGINYFQSNSGVDSGACAVDDLQYLSTERDTWFKGSYSIYLPKDLEPVSRYRAAVDKMRWDYGLDLDFATLWNLQPWSWLLDWKFNIGDVITNFSKWSSDAVVLHYGYVMQKTVTTYEIPSRNLFSSGTSYSGPGLPMSVIETTRKRRIRATPYGFGTAFGSLTLNQKAILAAIGITRF
ncbi:TPA_asm: maturation protein [ssRNA phage Esthiorhiza.3_3]|uniref:Maturation protein n=2 Tax=Leviviricetes TaxID=2842243 RepID=A0A8S5KYC0_9VIRU|nr:maturation protein [ssRNA phage Esthiorhiza.3_3]QDH90172.1 MAG: hypothetical protein H3RhizoLitter13277_000001 [Leviviridae sp.]DAD50164.1 TPA_asm: maturation protein [ssRNA phage Esthiorhiza.3_3]